METQGMYQIGKKLGEGCSGSKIVVYVLISLDVYLAIAKETNKKVAIKSFSKRSEWNRLVENEKNCLMRVQHCQLVAKLVDSYEDDDYSYLVFERIRGDDLLTFLIQSGKLMEHKAKLLFQQLAEIVHQIHESKVIHHGNSVFDSLFRYQMRKCDD
jgi:serine/threonine protein kinase